MRATGRGDHSAGYGTVDGTSEDGSDEAGWRRRRRKRRGQESAAEGEREAGRGKGDEGWMTAERSASSGEDATSCGTTRVRPSSLMACDQCASSQHLLADAVVDRDVDLSNSAADVNTSGEGSGIALACPIRSFLLPHPHPFTGHCSVACMSKLANN